MLTKSKINRQKIMELVIQSGIAFAFLFAAVAAFLDPFTWIQYFPGFLRDHFGDETIIRLFSLSEIVLALWILSGKKIFISSLVAAFYFLLIVISNLFYFSIVFSNVSLLLVSFSLAVKHYPRVRIVKNNTYNGTKRAA